MGRREDYFREAAAFRELRKADARQAEGVTAPVVRDALAEERIFKLKFDSFWSFHLCIRYLSALVLEAVMGRAVENSYGKAQPTRQLRDRIWK